MQGQPKTQQFKEYSGQNFLEVKYNKNDYDTISSNEAYTQYKQNVSSGYQPSEDPKCTISAKKRLFKVFLNFL